MGISPKKTASDLKKGDVGAVTKDLGNAVKNAPKTVQNAPKAVKEVTKTLPTPQVKVPKEIKPPGGGSVKTGEAGKTGPSVTPPRTQLPVPALPPVQLPALPQNGLTSGLGL